MSQTIRAVYESGTLRLLDPVELTEGSQISIMILKEYDPVLAALGDLVTPSTRVVEDDIDEEALLREINADFLGKEPLSETIIQERRECP